MQLRMFAIFFCRIDQLQALFGCRSRIIAGSIAGYDLRVATGVGYYDITGCKIRKGAGLSNVSTGYAWLR